MNWMKKSCFAAALVCSLALAGEKKQYDKAPEMKIDPAKTYTATIKTNQGTIKFTLLAKDSPKTVNNFVVLAKDGFYDGIIFHRVIKGFMIQGGDPQGVGTGGPGYQFADEIDASKELYQGQYKAGTVAMANAGPDTNGSQFFIVDADYPLPPKYTKFGTVTEGLDVVHKIAATQTDDRDKPTADVVMEKVTIEGE